MLRISKVLTPTKTWDAATRLMIIKLCHFDRRSLRRPMWRNLQLFLYSPRAWLVALKRDFCSQPPRHIKRYHSSVKFRTPFLLAILLIPIVTSLAQSQSDQPDPTALLHDLTADFARLAPQTIRPADGYIKHPYLIPSGYYPQMWDWDGFFIGLHWSNQNPKNAEYLRDWVLSFAGSADENGYV